MKNFVTSYPEFKKLAGNVSKHFTLMEELQSGVHVLVPCHLFSITGFYTSAARCFGVWADPCMSPRFRTGENFAWLPTKKKIFADNVEEFLNNTVLNDEDLVQLLMLYSLRYESNPNKYEVILLRVLTQVISRDSSKFCSSVEYRLRNWRYGFCAL